MCAVLLRYVTDGSGPAMIGMARGTMKSDVCDTFFFVGIFQFAGIFFDVCVVARAVRLAS